MFRLAFACLAISTAAHADAQFAPPSLVPPAYAAPVPPQPAPKTTNLEVSPVGVMFGFYSIAAERAVSTSVALALELDAANTGGGTGTSTQAVLSLPIYFKRAFSGPFFEPGVLVHASSYDPAYAGVVMLVGWTYMADSGFNITGAIGISRRIDNDGEDIADTIDASGYFRVGYAF